MAWIIADADGTWDTILAEVFVSLPMPYLDVLACVSQRWRALASSHFWKPALLLYSWGSRLTSGHALDNEEVEEETESSWDPQPRLLERFYSPQPRSQIKMVAAGDYYTLALSCGGFVFEWGIGGSTFWGDFLRPTLMPELRFDDPIVQVKKHTRR